MAFCGCAHGRCLSVGMSNIEMFPSIGIVIMGLDIWSRWPSLWEKFAPNAIGSGFGHLNHSLRLDILQLDTNYSRLSEAGHMSCTASLPRPLHTAYIPEVYCSGTAKFFPYSQRILNFPLSFPPSSWQRSTLVTPVASEDPIRILGNLISSPQVFQ
ncbi:hypothetical protein PCH_Pc15g01180 [Penicillium rubens Wisconsin 54-1255]|uniref:Uncharacterized protein n=1 Tax=Penicillium rubens (strain ATCC 28089 / DSM 1075 / NRRL 1951 / Wisconsin 54-1255) TaxID=500485 RepID=B6H6R2_PENRW|nr:hypothetical protein PCH_Pc15g01180 [Penicillium rubens Wisconsin 54-1255]